MDEITIKFGDFLFRVVKEPLLNGERQPLCFEAIVSPKSFAEPTQGRLLIGVEDGNLMFRPDGLAEGETEREDYACKWVRGLVRIELDSRIVCPECETKDSIKYNSGIEKLWCCECGVDASKVKQ